MIKPRPFLFIDGMNAFIRAMCVNQAVNSEGELVGGVLGFFKTLKFLTTAFRPEKIFIVWEQGGASPRRKHIFSEYKANRAKQKDFSEVYSENGKFNPLADQKNKSYQLSLLTKALAQLPVCQLYLPEIEGDDVIAWLCKAKFLYSENEKLVVSSDKDFYQLMEDPKVKIYDLGRKITLDQEYVKKTFGICPKNITLARCVAGDESDNVNGVPGVGLKTMANRFPELLDDTVDLNADWLMARCLELHEAAKKPPRCYADIMDYEEIVRRNWKLMYLDIGCLAPAQMSRLDYRVDEFVPKMNRLDYLKIFSSARLPITREIDEAANELKYLLNK